MSDASDFFRISKTYDVELYDVIRKFNDIFQHIKRQDEFDPRFAYRQSIVQTETYFKAQQNAKR